MNIEKFFETLGILYAENNNVKIKSFEIKRIKPKKEVS